MKDGVWTYYHANGKKRYEIAFVEDMAEGTATWWDNTGKVTKQTEWKAGKEIKEVPSF